MLWVSWAFSLLFMLAGTCSPLSTPTHTTEFRICYYFYPTITLINTFGLCRKEVRPELSGHRKQSKKRSLVGTDSSFRNLFCAVWLNRGSSKICSELGEPVKCVPCSFFSRVDVLPPLCCFFVAEHRLIRGKGSLVWSYLQTKRNTPAVVFPCRDHSPAMAGQCWGRARYTTELNYWGSP